MQNDTKMSVSPSTLLCPRRSRVRGISPCCCYGRRQLGFAACRARAGNERLAPGWVRRSTRLGELRGSSLSLPGRRSLREVGLGQGLPEYEIRSRLGQGGHIRSVFVVEVQVKDHSEFLPYFRTSWSPDFRPMRTSRSKLDRSYKEPRRLFQLIREFGFTGPIIMFLSGSHELGRFAVGLLGDGGAVEQALGSLEKSLKP